MFNRKKGKAWPSTSGLYYIVRSNRLVNLTIQIFPVNQRHSLVESSLLNWSKQRKSTENTVFGTFNVFGWICYSTERKNYEMKYSFETRAFCHLSKRFLSIFKGSRTYNLWWSEWNHLSNTPGSSKNSIFMNWMYFFLGIKTKRFDKWPRQLKRFTNLG